MTSLPVIWALTSGTRPSNGARETSNKKLKKKKKTSNRRKGLKLGNMSKKVIFYTKMQKDGKLNFRLRGTLTLMVHTCVENLNQPPSSINPPLPPPPLKYVQHFCEPLGASCSYSGLTILAIIGKCFKSLLETIWTILFSMDFDNWLCTCNT